MRSSIAIVFLSLLLFSCGNKGNKYTVIKGKTMGTTYEICYDSAIDLQSKIDYTLGFYSYLISTYDSNSLLSKFNASKPIDDKDQKSFENSIQLFNELNNLSYKVFADSKGAFNPAMGELINYWGFGNNKKNPEKVDSLFIKKLISIPCPSFQVYFNHGAVVKNCLNQQLNFNAIAPGHAVDIIAAMFDTIYHLQNYYINISGEIRAKGHAKGDTCWPIKIEKPQFKNEAAQGFKTYALKNQSLATSGNYRNYFTVNGKRYGHSIDPRKGFPAQNEMLSATIICESTAKADAYATACMVLGLKEAQEMVNSLNLKAFFIYDEQGKMKTWEKL